MAYVYPSLPVASATSLLDRLAPLEPDILRSRGDVSHPAAGYYATGIRVPEKRIVEVAASVRNLVDLLGFPEPRRFQAAFAEFDHRLPEILCREMDIVPADAADEGVWSFMTLVVLPDIAAWRYPDRNRERMLGLPRNVFRRLWWRGYVLGAGPEDPPAILGEDQLVAVMERPTIGGNPRLAKVFSRTVIAAQAEHRELSSMFIMRESAKRLLRLLPFVSVDSLEPAELESMLRDIVSGAVEVMVALASPSERAADT